MPIIPGGIPERPKGTDCKSVVSDFGGSNPPPSTIKLQKAAVRFVTIRRPWSLVLKPNTISGFTKPRKARLAGVAQLARASAFQAEGRGFESRFPLQYNTPT